MSLTPLPRFLLPSRARIRIVLMAVLAAIALGTVVFHLLEGWSILDSLYVTVADGHYSRLRRHNAAHSAWAAPSRLCS